MTPIQTLYTYLITAEVKDNSGNIIFSGINSDWTGPGGSTQPAPIVQMRLFDENAKKTATEYISNSDRILLIKQVSSGGGDRFTSSPAFAFTVFGKVKESPVYAECYANLIHEALKGFTYADCIIGIDPLGIVNGAYLLQSGRPWYDTEWSVQVDSGVIL